VSEGAGTGAAWKAPEDRAAPNLRTFLLAQSRRLKRHPNPHPAQPRGARDGARPWLLARSPAHSPAHSRKESGNPESPAGDREWISSSSGSLPQAVFLLVREFRPQK